MTVIKNDKLLNECKELLNWLAVINIINKPLAWMQRVKKWVTLMKIKLFEWTQSNLNQISVFSG